MPKISQNVLVNVFVQWQMYGVFGLGRHDEVTKFKNAADRWMFHTSEYSSEEIAMLYRIPHNSRFIAQLKSLCKTAVKDKGDIMGRRGQRTIIGATRTNIVHIYTLLLGVWLDKAQEDPLENIMIGWRIEDAEKAKKIYDAAVILSNTINGRDAQDNNGTALIGLPPAELSRDGFDAVMHFLETCYRITGQKALDPKLEPTFNFAIWRLFRPRRKRATDAITKQSRQQALLDATNGDHT